MARIQPILVSTPAQGANRASCALINRWVGELRNIPYGFCMQWKTPAEVAREPVADCKEKPLPFTSKWHGTAREGLRLVIGRRAPTSRSTHTWVQWTTASATYILDPTINWTARTLDEVADNSYVPYYAYAGHQSIEHQRQVRYARL